MFICISVLKKLHFVPPQKQFVKLVGESLAVMEKTRLEEIEEQDQIMKHRRFLSGFKDNNKMVATPF